METSKAGMVRRADTLADYKRFGVDPGTIALREDGRRLRATPGSFEWWYFEATLDTIMGLPKLALVIAFFDKPMDATQGPEAPTMSVRARTLFSNHGQELPPVPLSDFSADVALCDVRIGSNRCRVEGDGRYIVEFDAPDVRGRLEFTPSLPAVRVGTGYLLFEDGAGGDQYLGWLVPVPAAQVRVDCVVGGKAYQGTGRGYHDHNWGDAPLPQAIHHWYWGRAELGGYTINFARMTPQAAFGTADHADLVLAENGTLVACGSAGVTVVTGEESPDPASGKPFSSSVTVDFQQAGLRCVAKFNSILPVFRKTSETGAAAYHRNAAFCTLVVTRDGQEQFHGTVLTTFEMMWFGDEDAAAALPVFRAGVAEPPHLQEPWMRLPDRDSPARS